MFNGKPSKLVLAGANLAAIAGTLSATSTLAADVVRAPESTTKVDQINLASLQAIESTWLNVPISCKSRGFNAEPTNVGRNTVSSEILAIHSSMRA